MKKPWEASVQSVLHSCPFSTASVETGTFLWQKWGIWRFCQLNFLFQVSPVDAQYIHVLLKDFYFELKMWIYGIKQNNPLFSCTCTLMPNEFSLMESRPQEGL